MRKVVGIQFKEVGKIYWFDPLNFNLKLYDYVVVETIRGLELGMVVEEIKEVSKHQLEHELKEVLRYATDKDIRQHQNNIAYSLEAFENAKKIVDDHNLPMKLLDCEYTLDQKKLIIYYNADGRVDFRELLKDLASFFRVRIELRQVGPREGAKFLGGVGTCGREVCCRSHMREFGQVTMKMAKEQGIALNASKVAGLCGKLMCCISYEDQMYQELREEIPGVGDIVRTPTCDMCKVVSVNYLKKEVVVLHNDETQAWSSDDIKEIKVKHSQEILPDDLTDDVIEEE